MPYRNCSKNLLPKPCDSVGVNSHARTFECLISWLSSFRTLNGLKEENSSARAINFLSDKRPERDFILTSEVFPLVISIPFFFGRSRRWLSPPYPVFALQKLAGQIFASSPFVVLAQGLRSLKSPNNTYRHAAALVDAVTVPIGGVKDVR